MTGRPPSLQRLHARACGAFRILALAIGLGTVVAAANPALAQPDCTVSWVNPGDGDWNTPENWDTGTVPGVDDSVCILVDGAYTVTLGGSATIRLLTIGMPGTSGAQTLRIQASAGQPAQLWVQWYALNAARIVLDSAEAAARRHSSRRPATSITTGASRSSRAAAARARWPPASTTMTRGPSMSRRIPRSVRIGPPPSLPTPAPCTSRRERPSPSTSRPTSSPNGRARWSSTAPSRSPTGASPFMVARSPEHRRSPIAT